MKVLINARIPLFDPFLSGENQSILLESLLWVAVFVIYSNSFPPFLRSHSAWLPFWDLAKKRGGVFCENGRDDAILFAFLTIHHGIAGAMMTYGHILDDPIMWRHGYLLEFGYEMGDLLAQIFITYPYRHEGMKPTIKKAFVFHHLPGVLLPSFVLGAGLHNNQDLRAIGMWLLLGAFTTCASSLFVYSLDPDTQMTEFAAAYVMNTLFYFYCRFYQFPLHSYYLIKDVKSSKEFEGTIMIKLLYFGDACLTLFNVGSVIDVIPANIRAIKRAFDGVTPLEVKPVPPSREDRMKKE